MYGPAFRAASLLAASLLCFACRDNNQDPQPAADLSAGADDLSAGGDGGFTFTDTTIRDVNALKWKDGDRVKLTGVVTSPRPWATAQGTGCYYFIYIAQPDPTPTLKDGLRVAYVKFGAPSDMASSDSFCRSDASGGPPQMMKLMAGQKVEVSGLVDITTVRRQLLVTTLTGIKDLGPSNDALTSVEVDPKDYPLKPTGMPASPNFKDNQGALVRFTNVVTSARKAAFPFDFNIKAAMGTDASAIDTTYLWTIDPMTGRAADFVPPMDGTAYKSVTGILSVDFYKIWVRSPADLIP